MEIPIISHEIPIIFHGKSGKTMEFHGNMMGNSMENMMGNSWEFMEKYWTIQELYK